MKAILLLIVLLTGPVVFAQQKSDGKATILYDPSFWRYELRLNGDQYKRMQDINKEFYERLVSAFKEMRNDRKAFRSVYEQCWMNRNTQLWQTMNSRQKKKWKKITVAEQVNDADHSTPFSE